MKEICTLLVKLYFICSRMQRVNLHARPSTKQVGCPTCYQMCALDHAKGGTANLDYPSESYHRNDLSTQTAYKTDPIISEDEAFIYHPSKITTFPVPIGPMFKS